MGNHARILVADDEPLYLRTTGDLLRNAGYDCVCVPDARTAIDKLNAEEFDLVLSDLNMPGNLKLELLHNQHRERPQMPIIVITGVPTLPSAIESIRLGITDYLLKPVRFEDLLASVKRALSSARTVQQRFSSKEKLDGQASPTDELIGDSPTMRELKDIIRRVAASDTNVLITGESGTGKEVVAEMIHRCSPRSEGQFQIIDCTAVPESLFESLLFGHRKGAFTGAVDDQPGLLKQCHGGTAFFDELGELPLLLQAKLLRAVQEQAFTPLGSHQLQSVDTRFICATNRDLQLEVQAGRFRQDLYYRLGVIHIELPPLRERGEDVSLLAEHFLRVVGETDHRIQSLTPAALKCLQSYQWPGNIRELRNVIERAVALAAGPSIDVQDLPSHLTSHSPTKLSTVNDSVTLAESAAAGKTKHDVSDDEADSSTQLSRIEAIDAAEYRYLVGLLKQYSGNVSEAARQAELSRQGMHKLLKKHEIRAADYRP